MSEETSIDNCPIIAQSPLSELGLTGDLVSDCIKKNMTKYFNQLHTHSALGLHQLVMSEVEKPLLESVMQHTEKNQTKAAQVLGISRSTLRKKLAQYDLS